MEDYRKNRRYTAGKFAELGDKNPYSTIGQLNNEYESEAGIRNLINNIKIHFGRTYTKEEFIKKFACDKDAFKNSRYCSSSSQPNPVTPQLPIDPIPQLPIDTILSCVENYYNQRNKKIYSTVPGWISVEVKDTIWSFSKNKDWSQYNKEKKKISWIGKWECMGDSGYQIIASDGDKYTTESNKWLGKEQPLLPPGESPSTGGLPSTGVPPSTGGYNWRNTTLTIDELKSGKTVSMGTKGPVIGEIQKLLIDAGYKDVSKSGEPDNLFGSLTKAQVEKFQSENKDDKGEQLKKDGIVGTKTITALIKLSDEKMKKSAQGEIPTNLRLAPKDFGKI
jgi:hypothetical protein